MPLRVAVDRPAAFRRRAAGRLRVRLAVVRVDDRQGAGRGSSVVFRPAAGGVAADRGGVVDAEDVDRDGGRGGAVLAGDDKAVAVVDPGREMVLGGGVGGGIPMPVRLGPTAGFCRPAAGP